MEPEPNDECKDELLVGRILQGDAVALEHVYKRYGSLLYSVARRITDDAGSAEEILQDTFFQLWQSASLFDSARGSLIGWLLAMTRNRALSRLRQRRDRIAGDPEAPAAENAAMGPSTLEQEIARQLIAGAMDGLSHTQRQAITMAYFDGLTCKEIAVRTKSPEGTVKTRLRTALRHMKHDLKPRIEGTVRLEDILITGELATRICRSRASSTQQSSLQALSKAAKVSAGKLIECFLQLGMDLCRAGSAGLSFLEQNTEGNEVFRWTHLAGKLDKYLGGSTPRNFSPCGVTLDCDCPQLFRYQARYFTYFQKVDLPIVEALVIPFHANDQVNGTVWIASHDEKASFDSEDSRIMTALTEFIQFTFPLVTALETPAKTL